MCLLVVLALASLLTAAASEDAESGACLLQKRHSDLHQVAAHEHERRQEPESNIGEEAQPVEEASSPKKEGATSSEDKSNDAPKESGGDAGEASRSNSSKEPNTDSSVKNSTTKKNGEDKDTFDKKIEKEKEKFDNKSSKEEDSGTGSKKAEKDGSRDKDDSTSSLRLELWLPLSMKDLKGEDKGDLPLFTDTLKSELAKAANISVTRLNVLGVRGEYEDEGVSNTSEEADQALFRYSPELLQKETGDSQSIIDIEVLPSANKSDPSPQEALNTMRDQLGDAGSGLMKGPLKKKLSGAKLVMGKGVSGLLPKSGATHQESRLASFVLAAVMLPLWAAWAGLE